MRKASGAISATTKLLPRDTVAEMLARSDGLDADGLGLWIVEQKGDGSAGIVGLEPVSAMGSVWPLMAGGMVGGIEQIIALAPRFIGRGLATKALEAVIGHARQTLSLERLVAAVDEPNARSHRLMARAGFQVMGRAAGPVHALVLYAKTLAEPPALVRSGAPRLIDAKS